MSMKKYLREKKEAFEKYMSKREAKKIEKESALEANLKVKMKKVEESAARLKKREAIRDRIQKAKKYKSDKSTTKMIFTKAENFLGGIGNQTKGKPSTGIDLGLGGGFNTGIGGGIFDTFGAVADKPKHKRRKQKKKKKKK